MNLIDKILLEVVLTKDITDSSNLDNVSYDTDTEILEITFLSGATYEYYDVPESTYKQLIKAKSKGRFAYYNICYEYDYNKIG